jgi:hypothetical protein
LDLGLFVQLDGSTHYISIQRLLDRILSAATRNKINNIKQPVSIMPTNILMAGIYPTTKSLCISKILQQ